MIQDALSPWKIPYWQRIGATVEDWTEGSIMIVFRDGSRFITGIVSGAFGIHFDEERDRPGWVVTHLETGMLVTGLQPFKNVDTAKQFVARLYPLTDWSDIDPDNPPDIESEIQEIVEELLTAEGQRVFV
jgi:hypothetical protein